MKKKRPLKKSDRIYGRVQKDTWSGVVFEKEIYTVSPRGYKPSDREPRLRFNNEAERKAHKDNISRRRHVRLINCNFRPGDLYVTLTFNKKNECHDFKECWSLLKKYIGWIRYKYPNAKIAYYCGRGENTRRYHVHMLAAHVPEAYLIKKWKYGEIVDISRLWAHCSYNGNDQGPDYTKLANYLFDHWEPEQGAHRYHHTRNFKQPETDGYRPCRRKYSEEHPPAPPKGYKLVETKCTSYGYQYFKYVVNPREEFLDFDYGIRKPKKSRDRRKREEAGQ